MADELCHCGAERSQLRNGGPIEVIRAWNVERIRQLFAGELDEPATCDAGCRINVRATLVWVDEHESAIFLGPLFAGHGGRLKDALGVPVGRSIALRHAEDPDDLRIIAFNDMAAHINEVNSLRVEPNLALTWRLRTPEKVAALLAVGEGILGKDVQSQTSSSDVREWAQNLTLQAWLGMLTAWTSGAAIQESTLELDLVRYVDQMPTTEGVAGRFDELASDLAPADQERATLYLVEAIKASIHRQHSGATRSFADNFLWAFSFFEFFMAMIRHQSGEPGSQTQRIALGMRRSLISAERAAVTLDPEAAIGAATNLVSRLPDPLAPEAFMVMQGLAEAARYAALRIDESTFIATFDIDADQGSLAKLIRGIAVERPEALVTTIVLASRKLARDNKIDEVVELCDVAAGATKRDGLRTAVFSWLCRFLAGRGRHAEALARLSQISPAELRASSREDRLEILITKVRCLYEGGRYAEAIERADEALALAESPDEVAAIKLDQARAVRESGAPDQALAQLLALAEGAPETIAPYVLSEAVGWTYWKLGDHDAAVHWLTRAEREARAAGNFDTVMQAQLIEFQIKAGRQVDDSLVRFIAGSDLPTSPRTAVLECAALAGMARMGLLPLNLLGRLQKLRSMLPAMAEQAARQGTVAVHDTALRLLHLQTTGELSRSYLAQLGDLYNANGALPGTEVLISRAVEAYQRGAREQGRRAAQKALASLSNQVSGVRNPRTALEMGRRYRRSLDAALSALAGTAVAEPSDLRLFAEIRRDFLGRAILSGADDGCLRRVIAGAFSDTGISAAVPAPLSVLEYDAWDGGSLIIRTDVHADGTRTTLAADPPVVLETLAGRIARRLSTWTPQRPGDPFDLSPWRDVLRWIREILEGAAEDVVVIPGGLANLPWHVAIAETGKRCSYAHSWSDLISAVNLRRPSSRRLAIAAVPRFGDPAELSASFARETRKIRSLAGFDQVTALLNEDCDAAGLRRTLAEADLAVLLMHGYLDPVTAEVALMVAYDGRLPLAHSVASNSPGSSPHRLSWSTLDTTAPAVVASAACSSGLSHLRGLDDPAGIYSMLRYHGARSFIAPRWDVDISSLPVLTDIIRRMIDDGVPPGVAVFEAGQAALSNGLAPWMALPFSVEGSWR
ncbi:CHAT domain-containing protein [Actinoplanes sp. NPDC049548]|uniref:CHAT domain-containing protein n=1 Tax=Actinoplanes sp. NPDC049548 TaxID=3155152 RepID=UPI0034476FFE